MTSFVRKVLLCLLFAHWLAVTKCHGSTTRPVIDPRATDNDGNVTFRCSGNNELILLFWKVNGVSTVRTPGDQRDPLPEGVNNITINGSEQVLDIRIPKQPFYREKRLRLVCCAYIVQNGIPGREVCSAPPLCTGEDTGIGTRSCVRICICCNVLC